MPEINDALKELARFLKPYSFIRVRKAFFRIIGDGILQVVKFEYEPRGNSYSLQFGFFSMYNHMNNSMFTSFGSIPQFDAMSLVGKKTFDNISWDLPEDLFLMMAAAMKLEHWGKDESGRFITESVATAQQQLDVFMAHGMELLNRIQTDEDFLEAKKECKGKMGLRIEDDFDDVASYFKTGQFMKAEKIMEDLLAHNRDAIECRRQCGILPSEYSLMEMDRHEHILKIAREQDQGEISAWLTKNHKQNMLFFENHVIQKKPISQDWLDHELDEWRRSKR